MTDAGEQMPALDDVMEYPDSERDDDRRWIVLFEADYDNVAIDPQGNVGVLVDIEQAGEVLRLASEVVAALSVRDAEPDDPIRDIIDNLEDVAGGNDDD